MTHEFNTVRGLIERGQVGDSADNIYVIEAVSPYQKRVVIRRGMVMGSGVAQYILFDRSRPNDEIAENNTMPLGDFIAYCGSDWR